MEKKFLVLLSPLTIVSMTFGDLHRDVITSSSRSQLRPDSLTLNLRQVVSRNTLLLHNIFKNKLQLHCLCSYTGRLPNFSSRKWFINHNSVARFDLSKQNNHHTLQVK